MAGGVFQGATQLDSSDAVTLFASNGPPVKGLMTTQVVSSSAPFRYARYLAPNFAWGNLPELQCFGYGLGESDPATRDGISLRKAHFPA